MMQDPIDLTCLKALKMDADADRVARYGASIIVYAYAMARQAPALEGDARKIVDYTRKLYAILPSRDVIGDLAEDFMIEVTRKAGDRRALELARCAFVERLWQHFQHGSATEA